MKGSLVSGIKSGQSRQRERRLQTYQDGIVDKRMGKTHGFTIFRMGMDACAKCGKTRAEHE